MIFKCSSLFTHSFLFFTLPNLLHYNTDTRMRGHNKKLSKQRCNKNIRANFFTQHIVTTWNQLSDSIVNAPTMQSFENRLDKYWNNLEMKYNFKTNVFFSHHFLKYLHLKCAFDNILLISFISNFIFMICIIIIIDLLFVGFRFFSFCIEICKDILQTSKFILTKFQVKIKS
jgi:hypothetical protein